MAVTLRVIVNVCCESIQDAVQKAADLDSKSEALAVLFEDRVVVDARDLRRRTAEYCAN